MIGTINRREFCGGLATAAGLPLAAQESAGAPRRHPIQPWFSKAGLGLFLHWGPSSVGEVEIGWGMFKDVGAPNGYWPVEKYMALADRFNPRGYDPDKWLEAAAKAGFRYAVFVTRHCDGYAMWPSEHGEFGTKQKMKGRDLVRPFVEACRKHGMKAGFYYSPTNWSYNPKGWPWRGFPLRDPQFLHRRPERTEGRPRYADMPIEQVQKYFEILHAYVKGQVGELMTRYGKIDLVWWDGYDWPAGIDHHGREMEDYVRKLQPGIVLNDRNMIWDKGRMLGDFSTAFENRNPGRRPSGAWEQSEAICGGWSYQGEKAACRPASYLMERLVRNRAWGGNYLPDFGPRPDGTMSPRYYAICGEMAAWMKHSAESVFDVEAGPYPERSDVPVTRRGDVWYVHFLWREKRTATLAGVGTPKAAKLLRTGENVAWKKDGDRVALTLAAGRATDLEEVVAVRW